MQARLKVLHDKANVKQVKLLPNTLIGRSSDCNLKIASSQVSRNHCRITLGEDTVFVEDLGSANGTLVDGQPLPPHQPTAVAPGAHLLIGSAEFLIDYVAPTSMTMVLSRSGTRPGADLSPTEMIFPVAAIPTPTPGVSAPAASAAVASAAVSVPAEATRPEKSRSVPEAAVAIPVTAAAVIPVVAAPVATPLSAKLTEPHVPPPIASPEVMPLPVEPVAHVAVNPVGNTDTQDIPSGETLPDFDFAAAVEPEAGDTSSEEPTLFAFGDSPADPPQTTSPAAEPTAKKGGLKSLFSLFGRKDRTEGKENSTKPVVAVTNPPSVFLPTLEPQPVEVAAASPEPANIFAPETEVAAAAETTKPDGPQAEESTDQPDDGFQQFLQQL